MFNTCKRKATDCASATCNSEPTGEKTIYYDETKRLKSRGEDIRLMRWCQVTKITFPMNSKIEKVFFF
jgi:hypothetical protein